MWFVHIICMWCFYDFRNAANYHLKGAFENSHLFAQNSTFLKLSP